MKRYGEENARVLEVLRNKGLKEREDQERVSKMAASEEGTLGDKNH